MNKDFIVLTTDINTRRKFFTDEIVYFKADNSYTIIKQADGNEHTICIQLKKVEEILINPAFFRIGRTYLVNLNHCIALTKGQAPSIELINNEFVIPSKSRVEEIDERMFKSDIA